MQSAFWPIAPLEDNVFGLMQYESGAVASFHTSWTQWKNRFSLEIFCENGSVAVEGLGKSYGIERLITIRRNTGGGLPDASEQLFDLPDTSWEDEWCEFVSAILRGTPYMGGPDDGVVAMQTLDAVYRSARAGSPVTFQETPI